jgi:hypothetical protein
MDRTSALWQRNYRWNLVGLQKPGALDPNYTGTAEELARHYADCDTAEKIDRG